MINENLETASKLADKLLTEIDTYSKDYISNDGKLAYTQLSIQALNAIIEQGFTLYKYLVEKKLYEEYSELTVPLNVLGGYIEKLQITKENATKLHLSDSLKLWEQAKIAIAILSAQVLELYDNTKEGE